MIEKAIFGQDNRIYRNYTNYQLALETQISFEYTGNEYPDNRPFALDGIKGYPLRERISINPYIRGYVERIRIKE
jgi:hypothetical protein